MYGILYSWCNDRAARRPNNGIHLSNEVLEVLDMSYEQKNHAKQQGSFPRFILELARKIKFYVLLKKLKDAVLDMI